MNKKNQQRQDFYAGGISEDVVTDKRNNDYDKKFRGTTTHAEWKEGRANTK